MAAGLKAGVAFVEIVPKVAPGFSAAVSKEIEGPMAAVGSKISGVGSTLTKAISLPLVAGFVAVGAGVVAAGVQLDDAMDNIAIKTGETGTALEGLQDSFRNVAARVPDDFSKVSDAVAELHARTGMTGPGLEGLATQMLTLSRITGSDLSTTIEQSTRLFGDWSVGVDDQDAALDRLFKTSQVTGVGVDQLSTLLVQFGGPLRQLGFSMDESSALIAKFQKEGVNTELVLGSMRQALGRMARAGEEPIETFKRVTGEIKNAGDAGEANAKALELFGARAGPDMAAAIREGRFEIGGLLDQTSDFEGSIGQAASSTDGWSESFGKLKNRVILMLEPLATKLFKALDDLVPKLEPVIDWIGKAIEWFTELDPKWQAIILGVVALAAAAGPLISVVGTLVGVIGAILSPVGLVIIAIAALVAGLVYAYTHFEGFRNLVDSVVSWLVDNVPPAIELVVGTIVGAISTFVAWWSEEWPKISEAVGHVLTVIQVYIETWIAVVTTLWDTFGSSILEIASAIWDQIRLVIETAIRVIRDVIAVVVALINGDWGEAWNAIKDLLSAAWDFMAGSVGNALEIIKGYLDAALSAIGALWGVAWDAIKAVLGAVWDAIASKVSAVIDAVKTKISDVVGAISTAWSTSWGAVRDFLSGVWDRIKTIVSDAIDAVKTKISDVIGAISDGWSRVWGAIGDFLSLEWDGIKVIVSTAIGLVKDTIAGVLGDIKAGWQTVWDAISGIVTGVWDGIKTTVSDAIGAVVMMVGGIKDTISNLAGGMFDGISGAFESMISIIRTAWNAFVDIWNAVEVDIPSFDIPMVGTFGGGTFGLPDLPHFAAGGILQGLGVVGELGPELASSASKTRISSTRDLASMLDAAVVDVLGSDAGLRSSSGPAIVVEEANFYDDLDLELFLTKASFAATAGRFDG